MGRIVSTRLGAPGADAFYEPPDPLPDGEHGDVVWSRPLDGPAALASAAHNELVLYQSVAVDGTPIAVSGIVALPKGAVAPETGWPIVSWAHGTLGLGGKCAPSRDTDYWKSGPMEVHHRINQAPHVLLNAFLDRGWAVAMTDYEGMGTPGPHPFLLGESEARGVLDIVRAARQLFPEVSGQMAIVGHSQGGQAALFAANRAPEWTDELDLRGVGAMAPASYVRELVVAGSRLETTSPGLAFTALFLTGAVVGARGGIDPRHVLSDAAYRRFIAGGDLCRVELSEYWSFGGLRGIEQFRGDIGSAPNHDQREFLAQLDRMNPVLEIGVPVRIVQARQDLRVAEPATSRLVGELVALGNRVTYRIYEPDEDVPDPPDLGSHFGTIARDVGEMTAWLADRFADPTSDAADGVGATR